MNNRTKLALNILEAALLLGVLGDALLRETPWGLNVFLWTGALAAAMCALHGRSGGRASWRADGGWLWLPIAFFAAAFAWRDSTTLKLLDGLALFVAFALLAWRARGRKIRLGGLGDYALGLGHAAFDAMFASLPLVFSDVQWATIPRGMMRHVWAAARGLVLAMPLLFVFGALFMAADAVFEGIMRQTFQLDLGVLFSHFFLMLMFAWITGGFLRGMMLVEETPRAASEAVPAIYTSITIDDRERHGTTAAATGATRNDEPGGHRRPPESVVVEGGAQAGGESKSENGKQSVEDDGQPEGVEDARAQASVETLVAEQAAARGFSLGAVEVGVVLGLLNVLFACFVAVQFRYFFGGAARVMAIAELTYAEYARRGFFELTWVAGLVLPLLLGVHALLRKSSPAAERIFRPLAGAQIALLFVIMASAVGRMRLYQSEYGLTELRLYTTAFMLWLGLVFVWFAWTVLVRERRERFACGALVAAFATVGLLHLVNPDAYIVRANVAHARAGRSFDAAYAASLSADAVPALVSALPALSSDAHCLAERALAQRWTHTTFDEDWRGWNLARWRARRTLAAHLNALSETPCPPPASSVPAVTTTTPAPAAETPPAPKSAATSLPVAGAKTDNNTNAATDAAATISVNGQAKSATTAAAPNAARHTPGGDGKTKQHKRARVAVRTKARRRLK
ncbi:MAG TPA: DUF4173 domain-containing protein [Pyrinomonadaceae bacterium]|jgi:hypothetical protein|nr:DUF4173 domain-containing protein [Pyrinomonadaceae bacterium]